MKTSHSLKCALGAALLLSSTMGAMAGNYEDGVQIGPKATLAQQKFRAKAHKIHVRSGYAHHSEKRSGATFAWRAIKRWQAERRSSASHSRGYETAEPHVVYDDSGH